MSGSRSVSRSMQNTNAAVVSKLRPLSTSFFQPSLYFQAYRPKPSPVHSTYTRNLASTTEQRRSQLLAPLSRPCAKRQDAKIQRRKGPEPPKCLASVAVRRKSEGDGTEPVVRRGTGQQESTLSNSGEVEDNSAQVQSTDQKRSLLDRAVRYTREEYMNMLDYYRGSIWEEESRKDVRMEQQIEEVMDRLAEDTSDIETKDDGAAGTVKILVDCLRDESCTPEHIFEAYRNLPPPRVSYLENHDRQQLVKRLSLADHKSAKRAMNYFSVLDDFKAAKLDIPRSAWNSAIHLGGKSLNLITSAEVEVAIRTWKEMEHESEIRSDATTFNILFDIAAKAGKFGLAEMILDEMKTRKIAMTRFSHVTQIFYHGLRRDGEAVRNAYQEFVKSGGIVDTLVLDCVIASLLMCGEPAAAEAVFQRMKLMAAEREGKVYEPQTDTMRRNLGRMLDWLSRSKHRLPKARRNHIQSTMSMAPDIRTCNLLLAEFCKQGELSRAVGMLDEMQTMGIDPTNRTFRDLMHGFYRHGGVRYTTWTAPRLEIVWHSWTILLESEELDLYLTKWMAIRTLQAFRKCGGARRELEVWHELRSAWQQPVPFEDAVPRPDSRVSVLEHFA